MHVLNSMHLDLDYMYILTMSEILRICASD